MHPAPFPATVLMVTTTVASAADAQRLAAGAVGERLAACVQVEQIASHYVWKGRLHDEAEWRLACKTTAHAAPALCAWLRAQHPYEVPQLLAQPVQASEDYAQWVTEQVQAAPGD